MQVVSPDEAEHLLAQMAFELVVVDMQAASAPSDSGRLARDLRAAGCGPVLALTSSATRESASLTALGVRAVVRKPFTPQSFAASVAVLGVSALIPAPPQVALVGWARWRVGAHTVA